jgi:radical SAM superfamily enzyme YgiQ (UPF0313 family)
MNKITFIFPKTSWKFERTPYPPLGIGYLAAVLQQKNWIVSIIDGQILKSKDYEYYIQNINDKIVGISTSIKQIKETLRIAKLIKRKNSDTIILIGGPGAAVVNPQKTQSVDLIIKGEAEKILSWLLDEIRFKGLSEKKIKKWLSNKIITVDCKMLPKLDNLPYPARELFPLEKYLEIWKKNTGITSTSMISSRGCPYSCIFCDKNISGWKFRARSPKNVVEEMEYLSKNYQLDDIFFYDDLFVFNRQRVIEICQEIRRKKLKVSWSAQARVNKVDIEMLKVMKNAGCKELYFGVESGSDRILKFLKKGFNRKQIIETFYLCHQIGIRPGMYLIVGVPGETKEDIESTKRLIRECRPYLLNFSYLMPFPGTPLFKKTKEWIKHYNYHRWDEMNSSVYNFPFEINPKDAHDEIYRVFQEMVKEGMEYSPLQFCCEQ